MARFDATWLDRGDRFPEMELSIADGGTIRLPEASAAGWCILLFYRGFW